MKILVSEIPEEGLDLEGEEPIEHEGTTAPDEKASVSKTRLLLRVEKVDSEVLLKGTITARLKLACSRCLSSFVKDISVPVNIAYHLADELSGEDNHELHPDEMDTGFYRNDELDLQEISREQVLLNIPMKPLCGDSCKGICPKCGVNLNEGICKCNLKQTDDRLRKLQEYLKGKKE